MKREKNKNLDQAESLRSEVELVNRNVRLKDSLPSRAEIHGKKKQKVKLKIKYPLIKLLSLFFILMPITIYALYTSGNDEKVVNSISEEKKGFETIEINNNEPSFISSSYDQESKKQNSLTDEIRSGSNTENHTKHTEQKMASTETVNPSSKEEQNSDEQEKDHAGDRKNDEYKIVYHTVQPQETVFRISMKYYGSQEGIPLLKEWNNIQDNNIKVGQVLKVPIKK
ncbi:LysM peptidoglycan-binding domain-containing protein [Peribacillus tepidiphilus]|uniref:LysM peptidoglycan-binding domain-containing protein n=1 Tax=Peribacillus tepidiphilus TaxID=2652445 RepID=UPI001291F733|nr:LysM peptidoglycan-binding domain-containing protein [Peribacillus tepidiphilus]